ncbi:MAG TPA: PAS domain-containing sensor histidine kinase [Candidatus Limnocylindrales bacterium]|nr:PAS domain-containing sensor histidine kinase [Candidatus Limnocylindrales bacterium]
MSEPARSQGQADLLARIDALERDRRLAFDDAQREADALFAQYQLSQLIATGGPLPELAGSVLLELMRLADAAGGAIWTGGPGDRAIALIATAGIVGGDPIPDEFPDVETLHAWTATRSGARAVTLGDEAMHAAVAVWPPAGGILDEDGLRIALLARHELFVAFQGARLRQALERERHELGAIVDGATDLILQVDADGCVVRLNPAGERLLGMTAEAAIGRSCADVLGCEIAGGHALADCPLAEVRAGGQPIAYRESAVRGHSGAPIRVAGSYAVTAAGDGDEPDARATAILRDMSAVQALEELREGFVATVSHELRTPLALIRGYAETLLHLPLEPAQQRMYVERIDEATSRLAALVDQVLDVTHLQADPLILERRVTTFDSLVARLRGDLAMTRQADRLVVDAAADQPAIEVDIARVGQILANLVGNAIKYAPDGSPVVLGAAVSGRWLAVTVDDEGVGIPESERVLVTEPFHRAWNVRESRIPGTGLGLFICRRLVEAHGGELSVGDRPDGRPGTRVRITLPLALSETDVG